MQIIKKQTDAFNDFINTDLATKNDIKQLEKATKDDIKHLEECINYRIVNTSYKTIISLGSMIAIAVAILGFLIKAH